MSAPLADVRVLDFGQYVAVPFATMLLADLGADVVKVEPPAGDEWRRYDPVAPGESRHFWALNRNKRSVALDLKTESGRAAAAELIRDADAVVHNCLPSRAERFALDRESVRAINARCVWVNVSAFGSAGPDSERPAYDLISQALSGLLRRTAASARRAAKADGRARACRLHGRGAGGSFGGSRTSRARRGGVRHRGVAARRGAGPPSPALRRAGGWEPSHRAAHHSVIRAARARIRAGRRLDPYYRAYACGDGCFVALACLNAPQRRSVCALFGLNDPFVEDPQAEPADSAELAARMHHGSRIEERFAELTAPRAVTALTERGIPAAQVRRLEQLFTDVQAKANGLVQTVDQAIGPVALLGNVFKVDGAAEPAARGAPGLDQHRGELLGPPSVLP